MSLVRELNAQNIKINLGCSGVLDTKAKPRMQTVLIENKATRYLKAKDIEKMPQLQREVNTVIKQEFPNNSPLNEVYQIATAMIRASFNSMPSSNTMLTFLEEERDVIKPKLPHTL